MDREDETIGKHLGSVLQMACIVTSVLCLLGITLLRDCYFAFIFLARVLPSGCRV
jgi:hypothetical protein